MQVLGCSGSQPIWERENFGQEQGGACVCVGDRERRGGERDRERERQRERERERERDSTDLVLVCHWQEIGDSPNVQQSRGPTQSWRGEGQWEQTNWPM